MACEFNAIKIYFNKSKGNYEPLILKHNCKNCGSCLEVCFGYSIDYAISSMGVNELKSSIGTAIKSYIGYTNDENLRYSSSSGGIVPTIIRYLFDEKIIDGAIVVKSSNYVIPLTKSIIIKEKADVMNTIGSKYIPTLLTNILNNLEEGKNYALIGLPCQLYSFNKLLKKNKIDDRIFFKIGLLCGGIFNYNGLKYLMQKYQIKQNKILNLHFRGEGWPGNLRLKTKNVNLKIPYVQYWPIIQPWFSPRRCEICISGFNKDSDVSCGDAWLPELIENDNIGTSIIISRTKKGDLLIENLITNNFIKAKEVSYKTMIQTQNSMIRFRHLSLYTRIKVLKVLKKKLFLNKKDYQKKHPIKLFALIDEIKLQTGKLPAKREGTWILFKLFIILNKSIFSLTSFIKKNFNVKQHSPDKNK